MGLCRAIFLSASLKRASSRSHPAALAASSNETRVTRLSCCNATFPLLSRFGRGLALAILGLRDMSDDPRVRQAFALIAEAVSDAYQRGKADAISAMVAAASGALQQPQAATPTKILSATPRAMSEDDGRTRAPRGSAERVIKRAIAQSGANGATVADIISARAGELEMMLVDSSIRGELRRGEKAGKYVEIDGRWFEPS